MLKVLDRVLFANNTGEEISKLENGKVYIIKETLQEPFFYLKEVNPFSYSPLHGVANTIEKMVCTRWNSMSKNKFGFLGTGLSGMGKTALMRNICVRLNVPVILVKNPYPGNKLLDIMKEIADATEEEAELILFFDEFEKVYSNKETTNTLLTLFDGAVLPCKTLFLCTANDDLSSPYFDNRPGRFLFKHRFTELSAETAVDFLLESVILDEEQQTRLTRYFNKIAKLTYDTVSTCIGLIQDHGFDVFINMSSILNVSETSYVWTTGRGTLKDDVFTFDPMYSDSMVNYARGIRVDCLCKIKTDGDKVVDRVVEIYVNLSENKIEQALQYQNSYSGQKLYFNSKNLRLYVSDLNPDINKVFEERIIDEIDEDEKLLEWKFDETIVYCVEKRKKFAESEKTLTI